MCLKEKNVGQEQDTVKKNQQESVFLGTKEKF